MLQGERGGWYSSGLNEEGCFHGSCNKHQRLRMAPKIGILNCHSHSEARKSARCLGLCAHRKGLAACWRTAPSWSSTLRMTPSSLATWWYGCQGPASAPTSMQAALWRRCAAEPKPRPATSRLSRSGPSALLLRKGYLLSPLLSKAATAVSHHRLNA